MLLSMTGFGKSSCHVDNKNVVIEVRTLNSKNLDISLKLPSAYRSFEQELRNMLAQQLIRGKIELLIGFEIGTSSPELIINKDLLEKYYRELSALASDLGTQGGAELFASLLRLPEISSKPAEVTSPEEWETIRLGVQQAIEQTGSFRIKEGKHLEDDLHQRILSIREMLSEIDPLEQIRKEKLKEKLLKGLQELSDNNLHDPNRFEQELIYYLEKLDISEEKVRLTSHLQYFGEVLMETESSGKKLGFITQEIGREINTIGSKANDADIQKIVVQMKDELEKIKEQLMNIL